VTGALAFLISRSLANATKRRLKRLKEPRYLIGAIFGALYLLSFAMRPRLTQPVPHEMIDPWLQAIAGLGVFVAMLVNLVFGSSETLRFTLAEVDFLFTAPLTRRQVISYKIAAIQPALLFSAMLSLFFGVRGAAGLDALTRVLGLWIVYATLYMHFTAVSFARRSLAEHGLVGARRRLVFLGIATAFLAVAGVGTWTSIPHLLEALTGGRDVRDAVLEKVLGTPTMTVLLWAPKALVGPAVAGSFLDFARRLPASLLILGLHYVWVISSDAAFEEVAAEAAQKRAVRARGAGPDGRAARLQTPTARAFFRLSPHGSPVTALAWKNLAAFVRLGVSLRFLFGSLVIVLSAVVAVATGNGRGVTAVTAATLFLTLAALATVLGPLLLRFDLRRDLVMLDVLKVVPLRGAEIVAGELLAPLVVLGAVTSTLLIAGYLALITGTGIDIRIPTLPIFMSLMVLLLPILLVLVLIQNAAALVFPAWASLGPERATGFEVLGQRLVWMSGTFLGAGLMLVPAGLAGGVAFLLVSRVAGDLACVPAALAAAVVLLAEASIAILWLGSEGHYMSDC